MNQSGLKDAETFRAFVSERSAALVRSAYLLTGNEATAQDLVQTAILKTWRRWDRVTNKDDPEGYVRRVLMTTFLTWWRRRWRHEIPTATIPDSAVEDGDAELRLSINRALADLPARQRAVIVLRYLDDLSEADAARALGCSTGTVKSQTARALARLRTSPELSGLWDEEAKL
jgi:RNA polymerase sigma-70 factor (sigma-E family)